MPHAHPQCLLRPVRRRHLGHQRLGLRRDRDRAPAPRPHRHRLRRAQRHPRRAGRGPDRHRPGIGRGDRGAAQHAGRRLRLVPLQAQVAREEPARVRAADRGLQGARHRLLLLQRRRRFGRHLLQGEPAVAVDGLPAAGHPRAQDHRQRPAADRLLPRLRLGRQVRRGVHARGLARRALDGGHLHQGLRARGDGPPRGLDRGGRRAGGRPRHSGRDPVSRDPVRPAGLPGARRCAGQAPRLLHGGGVRGLPPPGRHLPGRAGQQGRLRPRAARRRGAGGGADGQGGAGLQVPLGGGRLPAALGAPHRLGHRRAAGLRARASARSSWHSKARTR